jgi:hypothetical protein
VQQQQRIVVVDAAAATAAAAVAALTRDGAGAGDVDALVVAVADSTRRR